MNARFLSWLRKVSFVVRNMGYVTLYFALKKYWLIVSGKKFLEEYLDVRKKMQHEDGEINVCIESVMHAQATPLLPSLM